MRNGTSLAALATSWLVPTLAFAAPAADAPPTGGANDGAFALAVVIGVGLAALGCGIGQGRAVSSALDGIARNPGSWQTMSTPYLMGLAFVEALTLFVWVLGILVYSKMS